MGRYFIYLFFYLPIFIYPMAKLITPLVTKQIDNTKPTEKKYSLFDGGGLYLEVTPTGSKLWRMKTKLNGKALQLSFGKYPDISLQQTRKKRDEARKLIAGGKTQGKKRKRA